MKKKKFDCVINGTWTPFCPVTEDVGLCPVNDLKEAQSTCRKSGLTFYNPISIEEFIEDIEAFKKCFLTKKETSAVHFWTLLQWPTSISSDKFELYEWFIDNIHDHYLRKYNLVLDETGYITVKFEKNYSMFIVQQEWRNTPFFCVKDVRHKKEILPDTTFIIHNNENISDTAFSTDSNETLPDTTHIAGFKDPLPYSTHATDFDNNLLDTNYGAVFDDISPELYKNCIIKKENEAWMPYCPWTSEFGLCSSAEYAPAYIACNPKMKFYEPESLEEFRENLPALKRCILSINKKESFQYWTDLRWPISSSLKRSKSYSWLQRKINMFANNRTSNHKLFDKGFITVLYQNGDFEFIVKDTRQEVPFFCQKYFKISSTTSAPDVMTETTQRKETVLDTTLTTDFSETPSNTTFVTGLNDTKTDTIYVTDFSETLLDTTLITDFKQTLPETSDITDSKGTLWDITFITDLMIIMTCFVLLLVTSIFFIKKSFNSVWKFMPHRIQN